MYLPGCWGHCFPPGVVLEKQCIGLLSYFLTACCYSYHAFHFGVKHSINSGLVWAPFPFWFPLTCSSNRSGWKQFSLLCSNPVSSCCVCRGGRTWGTLSAPELASQILGPLQSGQTSLEPSEHPESLGSSYKYKHQQKG